MSDFRIFCKNEAEKRSMPTAYGQHQVSLQNKNKGIKSSIFLPGARYVKMNSIKKVDFVILGGIR